MEPLFKQLKLLKIIDIFKLQKLKFYYKYKNNKLPQYLQSLPFHHSTETHDHTTHIQHNIYEVKTNHAFAKNCVHSDIPKIVNVTPNYILDTIHTHNLQGFSGYINAHILQSYQEDFAIVDCYVCTMQT